MHVNLSLSMFYSWTYWDYRVWQDDSLLFVGTCCMCACVVTANPPLWVTQLWFVLREAVGFSGQQHSAIAAAVQPRQHPHVFLTVPLHPVHCIMMALLQPAGKLLVAGRDTTVTIWANVLTVHATPSKEPGAGEAQTLSI